MSHLDKIHNYICPVHFLGFKSDTLTLQKAGWQLAFSQEPHRMSVRLALKHEVAKLHALTHSVEMRDIYSGMQELKRGGSPYADCLQFHICDIFHEGRICIMTMPSAVSFKPFDAMPSMESMSEREVRFDEFVPFRALNPDAPEIYVPQHTVSELLEQIMEKQDPKQREIREKARKEAWREDNAASLPGFDGYEPRKDIKAQIVTVAA